MELQRFGRIALIVRVENFFAGGGEVNEVSADFIDRLLLLRTELLHSAKRLQITVNIGGLRFHFRQVACITLKEEASLVIG
ncbi:hypothetical protein D3C73_1579300 [compost metagenome]